MDGSQGSNGTPPFLTKTYDMVDDPSTNSVVSWSLSGKSFVVWNPLDFARDLLPKYFKHNNFSSFIRQLNTYGFRKIDPEQWEFANDEFIRGQRRLLKNIHRRKPIHSHSQQHHQAQGNSSGVLSEAERQELEEVIERLKHEKNMLLSEVQRNNQQKLGIDLQMQSLEERLHHMEHRQLQMRDFLMRIVQRPGFVSNLLHQSENHNKKRRLPKPDSFGNDTEDDEHVAFQAVMREKSDIVSVRVLNTDPFEKMESSINSWENFFRGVGHASGEEMYGGSMQWQPSTVVLTEVLTSYRDPDSNLQPESPKIRPSSPHSRDIRSSPDLTESTSFVESPAISPICLPADNQVKDSWIDVNSRPAPIEVQSSQERTNIGSAAPTGENDVFWEQFLTETPGSSDTRDVQLESRDADSKKCGSKQAEFGNFWWNKKSVDQLTEQMGQLSPAERT